MASEQQIPNYYSPFWSNYSDTEIYMPTNLTENVNHISISSHEATRPVAYHENLSSTFVLSENSSIDPTSTVWTKIDIQDLFKQSHLNMKDYLGQAQWVSSNSVEIITKHEQFIQEFVKPIGISMLHNGNLVIAERGYRSTVGIFDPLAGTFLAKLRTQREFMNPSDIAILPNGCIVVRDDIGLQIFDNDANFVSEIMPNGIRMKKMNGVCYGVKCDQNGLVVTLSTNPYGQDKCITRAGETDLLIIDITKNTIVEKIELLDVIMNQKMSKCRFLECCRNKIYVSDLGLHHVYVIDRLSSSVSIIGNCGAGPGQFLEPAGLAVDSVGNLIVSDAGNNRLQLFDNNHNFLGYIGLNNCSRPSGILLDRCGKALYVLNLRANSLLKLTFPYIPTF